MSDADLKRSYREYAASMPRRVRCSVNQWQKGDGAYWEYVKIKGAAKRYHVITARDVKCFDEGKGS